LPGRLRGRGGDQHSVPPRAYLAGTGRDRAPGRQGGERRGGPVPLIGLEQPAPNGAPTGSNPGRARAPVCATSRWVDDTPLELNHGDRELCPQRLAGRSCPRSMSGHSIDDVDSRAVLHTSRSASRAQSRPPPRWLRRRYGATESHHLHRQRPGRRPAQDDGASRAGASRERPSSRHAR